MSYRFVHVSSVPVDHYLPGWSDSDGYAIIDRRGRPIDWPLCESPSEARETIRAFARDRVAYVSDILSERYAH